jgi:predicted Zn-dependent protease
VAEAPRADTPALAQARDNAKAHPRDAKALRSWTRAALRAKDLLEAKRAADAWASYDPSSEPRIVQAQILDAMGRRQDAKTLLEAYLRKNPHSEDAKRSLGRMETLPRLENASAKKPIR